MEKETMMRVFNKDTHKWEIIKVGSSSCTCNIGSLTEEQKKELQGKTWRPFVSVSGALSWELSDNMTPPSGALIKGPKGDPFKYSDFTAAQLASLKIPESGVTAKRPSVTAVGYQYFDTTIKKPIWWSGDEWVDANGITV